MMSLSVHVDERKIALTLERGDLSINISQSPLYLWQEVSVEDLRRQDYIYFLYPEGMSGSVFGPENVGDSVPVGDFFGENKHAILYVSVFPDGRPGTGTDESNVKDPIDYSPKLFF